MRTRAIRRRILVLLCVLGIAASSWAGCNVWTRCGPDLDRAPASVAVDPCAPGTVYVGSWDKGIFKTTDGGATWAEVNGGLSLYPTGGIVPIRCLAVDPVNTSTVYCGISNNGGEGFGVYKTTDSGGWWSPANAGLPQSIFDAFYPIVISTAKTDVLFVGDSATVYKSKDGGESWAWSGEGMPWASVDALAMDPSDSETLYAGLGDCFDGGV